MKTPNPSKFYVFFLLTMFLFSCSSDTTEISPELTSEIFPIVSSQKNPIIIVKEDAEVYRMLITYVSGTTGLQKAAIRDKYYELNYLISVDRNYDPSPDVELWYIRSNCPEGVECRPRVYHPNDPDIESSVILPKRL